MTAPDLTTPVVIYKEIERFWGYRFGDDGSIWSRRKSGYGHLSLAEEWHRVHPVPKKSDGYLQFGISIDGKKTRYYVHRMILEAFVGPCPEGMEACHNNGNRANNRLDNLRWDSRAANSRDRDLHGTVRRGSMQYHAKLSESEIPVIRQLRREGWTLARIAERHRVSLAAIHNVIQGRSWRHV